MDGVPYTDLVARYLHLNLLIIQLDFTSRSMHLEFQPLLSGAFKPLAQDVALRSNYLLLVVFMTTSSSPSPGTFSNYMTEAHSNSPKL